MTTQSKHGTSSDLLVLGATGKTGRRLVARLRDAGGARVRAASRSGEVTFDWTVPATWEPALAGAGSVYLVAPEDPSPVEEFVRRATASGVHRFVVLSGHGIEKADGGSFGLGMAAAEGAVRGSGAEWTLLRANNFFQNFDEDLWLAPLRAGRLGLPDGGVPEPFIDADDVAAVAAAVLTEPGHAGRAYELSGPRGLTFAEATRTIAEAAGRPIRYEELTPASYRAELLAEGWPPAAADGIGDLFEVLRAGHMAEVTDDVRRVLGREPADLEPWARRVAARGTWAA
ncbi:NAD(P)H-binding protein [Streptomyces subrutilus]|uniref:NmrA family transcriptional regulator n=1 Tax=Streptomyces subrutilus TaxID=36818 RepID=A0A5P2UT54_9ACTN|nr:NAD(P)H-binding protein [Streptomyces subrutilus]QEU82303.1 SDR family NAD(P)-dependent oxidoreductase [Streptomyces subrutilus]WSJ28249.1 NAD(P)H-binding protein [Streptomyces subrutilus]GGZ69751.1 NmrA family transcriptional regulator [Streptomyces subrutilus]